MALKDWKKLNAKSTPKGKIIYVSQLSDNWVGVGKNPSGDWTAMTGNGVQPSPFEKKSQAMSYIKEYMRRRD